MEEDGLEVVNAGLLISSFNKLIIIVVSKESDVIQNYECILHFNIFVFIKKCCLSCLDLKCTKNYEDNIPGFKMNPANTC